MFNRAMMFGVLVAAAALASDLAAAEKAEGKSAGKAAKSQPAVVKAPAAQKGQPAVVKAPAAQKGQPAVVKAPAAQKSPPKVAQEKTTPAIGSRKKADIELGLLSDNEPELLSGNRTELLSGNSPELLSGNRASVLSGNSARLVSKVNVLSGIKIQVNITITGNNNKGDSPDEADSAFGRYDVDGDGRLSPAEFRQSLEAKASPASF